MERGWQGRVNGVANVSDLSALSSLVVLPFFFFSLSYCRDIWTMQPSPKEVCFRVWWFLWSSIASSAVFWSTVFGNMGGGLFGWAVKAYRETSAIKSLSSICVNMSWPDDFISRYLFVSLSTPPIINRPPCILKHAECVWWERERQTERESMTVLVCGVEMG